MLALRETYRDIVEMQLVVPEMGMLDPCPARPS